MKELTVVEKRPHLSVLSPITIREKSTTRLVFIPQVTNSLKDKRKPLKGTFVFQRKGPKAEWEDIGDVDLTKLKAGEGVRLDLDTAEIHVLKEWFNQLYRNYERNNATPVAGAAITMADTSPPAWHYDLPERTALDPGDLVAMIQEAELEGRFEDVAKAMSWVLSKDNAAKFIEHISRLNLETIEQVNSLTGVTRMKAALARWEANRDSADESMWQAFFRHDSYLLSQIFSFPVIMFGDEAYLGGKAVDQKGAKLIDFLLTTKLTNNVMLLEVKTPATTLLGSQYRNGVFRPHGDLVGPVAQIASYKQTALTNYSTNREEARKKGITEFYDAFDPRCVVIAGDTSQFDGNFAKRMNFDLYRNNLRSADVVTFDELFEKTRTLIRLLEGDTPSVPTKHVEADDEPPF